jgi:predicted GNAT family acetyltransferase
VNLLESAQDLIETRVKIIRHRGERDGFADDLTVADSGEDEVGPTCVECQDERRERRF